MKRLLAVFLAAACIAAETDHRTLEAPKGALGKGAIAKYEAAAKAGQDAMRQALVAAETQLISDINDALKAAMKSEQLEEANRLDRVRREAEGRLDLLQKLSTPPLPAGNQPPKDPKTDVKSAKPRPRPPATAVRWNGHSYLVVDRPDLSKTAAQFMCEDAGGRLVDIETMDELNFLRELLSRAGKRNSAYWTGGFRADGIDGRWRWSDGSSAEKLIQTVGITVDDWNREGCELQLIDGRKQFKGQRSRWGQGYICEWAE